MAQQGAQGGSTPPQKPQVPPNVGAPSAGAGQKAPGGPGGPGPGRPGMLATANPVQIPYQAGAQQNLQGPAGMGNPTNPQLLNMYQMQKTLGQQPGPAGFGTQSGLTPQRLAFLKQFGLPAG